MSSSREFSDVAIVLPREIKRLPEDLSRFLLDLLDNPNLNLRFVGMQMPQNSMNYMDKFVKLVTWLERTFLAFSANFTPSREKNDALLKLIQTEISSVKQSFKADLIIDFTNRLEFCFQTPVVRVNTLLLTNGIETRNLFNSVLSRENFSNGFLQLLDSSTNRTRHLKFQLMTRKYLSHNLASMRGTELGLLR